MDSLQRRVIQEDVIQYKLFPIQPHGSSSQQTEEHLTHLTEEILAKVAPLLIQYIWQHQSFNLKYHPEKGIILSTCQRWIDLSIGAYFGLMCVVFFNWQEMSLLTLEAAPSLGTMWRTSGLLFTSCSKSQRPSQSSQPGETKCALSLYL